MFNLKKVLINRLLVLFLISSFLFFPKNLFASEIFYKNSYWEATGNWNVEIIDGKNVLTSNASQNDILNYIYLKDGYSWKDYTLKTRIKAVSGVDLRIIFRAKSHQANYFIGLGFPESIYKGNYINLWKTEDGQEKKIVGKEDFILNHNQWYEIKISSVGNNFKIYVDDQIVFDVADPYGNIYDKGTIGFAGWSGAAGGFEFIFDYVKVESPPPSSPPRTRC